MAVDVASPSQAPPAADLMAGLSEKSRDVTAKILQMLAAAATPLPTPGLREGHRIRHPPRPAVLPAALPPGPPRRPGQDHPARRQIPVLAAARRVSPAARRPQSPRLPRKPALAGSPPPDRLRTR